MKLFGFLLCFVAVISFRASAVPPEQDQIRTALPWLYLLAYQGALSQVPIARPQDEASMKLTQSDEMANSNLVREQFLQGILQGLQQPGTQSSAPTISPALLADIIAQATTTTKKPTVEKDINGPDNDEDVDYIDFKNGSRIKYDLDEVEQPVNKILQRTTRRSMASRPQSSNNVIYYRTPVRYVYYRPPLYYYRGG
ncbi:uncharacterized protein LOC108095107 [Drosophila ficusphila]|uniref:uncharacterized protein LOC108095107 n=1 Tax=Drosophila ficusphila TaxID=30025 RepID=UPI0007E81B87|nr:uncharacterized protein LOC108095107 [Drosophila ficusphila]